MPPNGSEISLLPRYLNRRTNFLFPSSAFSIHIATGRIWSYLSYRGG